MQDRMPCEVREWMSLAQRVEEGVGHLKSQMLSADTVLLPSRHSPVTAVYSLCLIKNKEFISAHWLMLFADADGPRAYFSNLLVIAYRPRKCCSPTLADTDMSRPKI